MLLQIISGAFGKLNEHKKPLAQALLIPFALLWGWHFFYFSGEDGLHQFVLDFADCVIITIFAVVTHRIILLGPESVSTWGLTRWTSRETKFCFYLALFILALIPGYLWFPEDDLEDQWGFIDYLMPGY